MLFIHIHWFQARVPNDKDDDDDEEDDDPEMGIPEIGDVEDEEEIGIGDTEDGEERDLDEEEEEAVIARDLKENTIVSMKANVETTVAKRVSVESNVAPEATEDESVSSAPPVNTGIDVFRLRRLTKTESFAYFTYANDIPVFTLLD